MMLLQVSDALYGVSRTSTVVTTFVIGVAATAALIFVGTLIARSRQPRSAAAAAQYSAALFKRAGRNVGLSPAQVDTLENLVRVTRVKQPFLVFTSAGLLDDTLKKGLYSIDAARGLSDEERENRRTVLFQIKQTIEGNARKGASLGSTTFLRPGQVLSITPEGGAPFSSKVVSNMKDFLTTSVPAMPAGGGDSRWIRGTKLSVYLWRENDAGYSFVSKVLGYDTVKGIPSVLIQHSRTLRREQRRRNRRRELLRACFCYPIRITETGEGRKIQRKAVVEQSQRTLGTIVDLSAGGCAVQTTTPVEKGRLVMVEFDIDRRQAIRVFGKVVQVRKQPGKSGMMNIMFTRVTRQHLNRISEFVYDFSRPTTVGQAREQMDRAPGRGELPTPHRS
jgi:c-di-GMP-binding flagellar brake protein YcgR